MGGHLTIYRYGTGGFEETATCGRALTFAVLCPVAARHYRVAECNPFGCERLLGTPVLEIALIFQQLSIWPSRCF